MMDIVCFSHLRWDFVYQRPQHLMSRAARTNRVFFIEEPVFTNNPDGYKIVRTEEKVLCVTPQLFSGDPNNREERRRDILESLFSEKAIDHYLFWYYTPMMLDTEANFNPVLVVYDCMDELSAFKYADPLLKERERLLFKKAAVVFTGGPTLYRSKRRNHSNVFCFPSSIDFAHFAQARKPQKEPADQQHIPHPRLGFFGVIDERFDIDLLRGAAALRPDHQFVIIGPVVKIDPAELPQAPNIHYLGPKKYAELPAYVSGWDVALVLFALNESTKFISPTKTPEYLAAGRPVISTPIADVINPYGEVGLVQIAGDAGELSFKAAREIAQTDKSEWLASTDEYLSQNSWDITWMEMKAIIGMEIEKQATVAKEAAYV